MEQGAGRRPVDGNVCGQAVVAQIRVGLVEPSSSLKKSLTD
jgi:hypothetical protein